MIRAGQLSKAIDELVPPGRPVMVHASLRSFGSPIAGGADEFLDALSGSERTVLVPTFTEPQFGLPAPVAPRPARNGIDYAAPPAASTHVGGAGYTVDCGLVNPGLGVLPAMLVNRCGMVRGTHPLNSFAAIGPLARTLISAQSRAGVYGPIRELAAHDGVILLVGVGLDRMTALHLAEQQSGRRLFRRWARDGDHRVSVVEVGSCSEGFPRLEPFLGHLARSASVGSSAWRAFPARETLAAATAAMTADQSITRCADGACLLCRDSIAGGPIR